mmetsp:Transcript_64526/g.154044  ORF Transcript_64526/g.154044 Transcript_64526/m.154044 type:complete len:217 (-) Transcript_64526:109-759(-)
MRFTIRRSSMPSSALHGISFSVSAPKGGGGGGGWRAELGSSSPTPKSARSFNSASMMSPRESGEAAREMACTCRGGISGKPRRSRSPSRSCSGKGVPSGSRRKLSVLPPRSGKTSALASKGSASGGESPRILSSSASRSTSSTQTSLLAWVIGGGGGGAWGVSGLEACTLPSEAVSGACPTSFIWKEFRESLRPMADAEDRAVSSRSGSKGGRELK